MLKAKERGKWLIALALCVSCFVLCASLMTNSAPTFAEPAPAPKTVAVNTLTAKFKNAGWAGPAAYTDNKDAERKDSFKASAKADTSEEEGVNNGLTSNAYYDLKDKGYVKLTGTIVPVKDNPAASALRVTITTQKYTYETSPENPNVQLLKDTIVIHKVEKDFTKDSDAFDFELPLAAFADAQDLFIVVSNSDASGDEASLIFTGLVFTEKEAPPPAGPGKYKPVTGYKNLFEVLDAEGNSKSPKEYIFSPTAPEDGKEPPAAAKKAYAGKNNYYIEFVKDAGIFVAVKADGALDITTVLWWGPDGQFGTEDDFETKMKELSGYFFWEQKDGAWKLIENFFDPARTTTAAPETSSTTAAPGQSSSGPEDSTTEIDYLSTDESNTLPKTGREVFSVGLAVCMAILLMGCAYCGYQAFRRRAVRAK